MKNHPLAHVGIGTKLDIDGILEVNSPLAYPENNENPPIRFSQNVTKGLLPPLSHANFQNEAKTRIKIESLILIPSHPKNIYKIEAVQQFTFSDSGDIQLNIFITYDASEGEITDYIPYLVSLDLNDGYLSKNKIPGSYTKVKTVKTFLVNTDPESSRGTVTTVQPPVLTTPPPQATAH